MPEQVSTDTDFALVRLPSGPTFGWRGAGFPFSEPLRSHLVDNGFLYDAGGGTAYWTWAGLLTVRDDVRQMYLNPN